jgi:hypothetical protein
MSDHSLVCLNPTTGEVSLEHGGRSREEVRAYITSEGARLLNLPAAEQLDMRVEHKVADGMYMRTLLIPKGTILVGKVHLKPCMNIVASGDISVLTEFGSRRCTAGFTGVSQAGIQKLGFAHEDTVFINVFRTDEVDIDRIEQEIATTDCSLILAIQQSEFDADREDYASFLAEYGLQEEVVRTIVDDMSDHIDLPEKYIGFTLGASLIHGDGVFATQPFVAGQEVGPARIGRSRTLIGRVTNHAKFPNCRFDADADDLVMSALCAISPGQELTIDYRQAARVNTSLGLRPVKEM